MNAADKARAAAMQFEAKKDGLSQQQSGEWKLNLKVHANDVPAGLLTAAMGTRYQVVIVEIGDDEQPVEQKPASNPHRLSQQATILCQDKRFQMFLYEERSHVWQSNHLGMSKLATATNVVRHICHVKSRSEFDSDPKAAARWRDLHGEFEAWKLTA